ncbi:MAG: hypothetical protein KAR13_12920 [Desulfobulbaceae bacterium]|nr:hypothetical protein [Desulfobulbaceae bacterium]
MPPELFGYIKLLMQPGGVDRAKGAAWAAHFLADMSVPYHVVGMTRDDAYDFHANQKKYLDPKITGPLYLYDNNAKGLLPPRGWGGNGNFWDATVNYSYNHSGGMADWYDPWYSNGYGLRESNESALSSHVLWESRANKIFEKHPHFHPGIFPNGDGRYNPAWKNAIPSYELTDEIRTQAKQSALFTHAVALYTRQKISQIHRNPGLGIDHAIRNVATLWRSTFTGLRPTLGYYENVSDDPNEYIMECCIRNAADAGVSNVNVMLLMYHNTKLVYTQKLTGGNIAGGGNCVVQFKVRVAPDTKYGIVMAVAGQYDIPDLQYATADGTFRSNPVRTIDPPVTVRPPQDPFENILGAWEFGRNKNNRIGTVILTRKIGEHGYIIDGYSHHNESYWRFNGKNSITFIHKNGNPTTYFQRRGPKYWEGRFRPPKDWPKMENAVVHYLKRK